VRAYKGQLTLLAPASAAKAQKEGEKRAEFAQALCTPSHTTVYLEGQTMGARGSAQNRTKRRFDFVFVLNNATMISLVELLSAALIAGGGRPNQH
jgi:hypothetical protein